MKDKAFKLAMCDGWMLDENWEFNDLGINLTSYKKGKECVIYQTLIENYSCFNKLMELFENINKNTKYSINITGAYVSLNEKGCLFMVNYLFQEYTLKEALMDCLLEYYKEIKNGTE